MDINNYILNDNKNIIDDCLCKYLKNNAKKHMKKHRKTDKKISYYNLPELTPDELLIKLINNYNDLVEKYAILYNNYMFLISNIKLLKEYIDNINDLEDLEDFKDLENIKEIEKFKEIKIKTTNKIINENKIDINIVKYLEVQDKIKLTDFISERYNIYVTAINKLSQIISRLNKIFSKDLFEKKLTNIKS